MLVNTSHRLIFFAIYGLILVFTIYGLSLSSLQMLLCQSRELRECLVLLLRCRHQGDNVPLLEMLVNLSHTLLMLNEKITDLNGGMKPFNTEKYIAR